MGWIVGHPDIGMAASLSLTLPTNFTTIVNTIWGSTVPTGDISTNISAPCWTKTISLLPVTVSVTAVAPDQLIVLLDQSMTTSFNTPAFMAAFKAVKNAGVTTADINAVPVLTVRYAAMVQYEAMLRSLLAGVSTPNFRLMQLPLRYFTNFSVFVSSSPARTTANDSLWYPVTDTIASANLIPVGASSNGTALTFRVWIVPAFTFPKVNGIYSGTLQFVLVTQ